MSNIHVAKFNPEQKTYDTPVAILGAKSVECTYEAQSTSISADDKVVYTVSSMAEGSGSLTVLGLTGEEKKLIFGGKATKGFALGVDDVQPQMALLFEQKKADGKKMLYCIFNVKFNPAGLSATSIEGGQIEEQTISLKVWRSK